VVRGDDPDSNLVVRSGDVINVSTASLVYVVGAVVKPGGYALPDPVAGMSVIRALAMAQGFRPAAGSRHSMILRQSTSDSSRREVPVDLKEILDGKSTDVVLAPDDILYIPDSNSKKALKVMADVALSLINGIAVYGVGYRIGSL
jgi:polysaccharide export outer membrane protein